MKNYKIKVIYDHNEPAVFYEIEAETKIKAYSAVIKKYRLSDILKIKCVE